MDNCQHFCICSLEESNTILWVCCELQGFWPSMTWKMLLSSNSYTPSDEKIMVKPVGAELIFKHESNCYTVKLEVSFFVPNLNIERQVTLI